MKRIFLVVAVALGLSVMALANSVDFTNVGGTLTSNKSGGVTTFSLTGSTLVDISGNMGRDLGSVSFTTGAFTGKLDCKHGECGTFASGGSFTITRNGHGIIFSGSFSCGGTTDPCSWSKATLADGKSSYTLNAMLTGMLNGEKVTGATMQVTVFFKRKGKFTGKADITTCDTGGRSSCSGTYLSGTVPEPGSLSLLGTGLIGLAGLARRKLRS